MRQWGIRPTLLPVTLALPLVSCGSSESDGSAALRREPSNRRAGLARICEAKIRGELSRFDGGFPSRQTAEERARFFGRDMVAKAIERWLERRA